MIFYHNDSQMMMARRVKAQLEARIKAAIFTEIMPFREFYQAEGYHQKYYLRSVPELAGEYLAIYPDIKGFVASTAAARVNGYIGRYGTKEQLDKEIGSLGLSAEGQKRLLAIVGQ